MSTMHAVRSLRALALVLVLVLGAAACGGQGERPGPTAANRQGIFEELARRGGRVESIVSGDPGCADAGLAANAVRVKVTPPADGAPAVVYLFTFKDQRFWEASRAAVDACVAQYASEPGHTGRVDRLDISPYRLFGPGWSPGLRTFLDATLREIAGDGGVPRGRDGRPLPTGSP
jgi:hypothetical protein